MLRKEVLPARVWEPCRRHEDRSPPIMGLAPTVVSIVIAVVGYYVWQLRANDEQAEGRLQQQRAIEMEIRADVRAIDEFEQREGYAPHWNPVSDTQRRW